MAKTKKETTPVEPIESRAFQVTQYGDETEAAAFARSALRPSVTAAFTRQLFMRDKGASINEHVDQIAKQAVKVQAGDLKSLEAMLVGQAQALDAAFHVFARRAATMVNEGRSAEVSGKYMQTAMRAQAQCRASIQAIGELKNPRSIVVARQANISSGPQQVNNGVTQADLHSPARGKNFDGAIRANELLEHSNGEWLDAGAASEAKSSDSALEAVEIVDRPGN